MLPTYLEKIALLGELQSPAHAIYRSVGIDEDYLDTLLVIY